MKRIINGRLWDDSFMYSVESRAFDVEDPVTGETKQYREELLREYVLKPGRTLGDTWVEGTYGRRVLKDNCDLRKGQFILKRYQGYSDGVFILLSDEEAKVWFERWFPEQTDRYAEVFGEPASPWTGSGEVRLVEQAESRLKSANWDRDRAEERAKKAEAEIAALKAKIEALEAAQNPVERPGALEA